MFKERYEKALKKFISDKKISKENKEVYQKFFSHQEVKLRRMNGLTTLDEASYKTLLGYIYKFKNVEVWFNNTPFSKITQEQFDETFRGLADGKILNSSGESFKDIESYVFKIFKSKLFKLAGLTPIVENCTDLEFYKAEDKREADFVEDKDMNRIIEHISTPKMKLLIQLGYDIGENISTLLQLRKRDCRRQFNEATKEYEYLIHLKKEDLKRSRKTRVEPTRLPKSTEMLEFYLKDLNDEDYLFVREDNMVRGENGNLKERIPFSLRSAEIFFEKLVKKLKIKTTPKGNIPKLKTIRSSMACDCLKKGWTIEEINSRLGHSINSKALKPYITFSALDKKKPKIREYKENLESVNEELKKQKEINLLLDSRLKDMREQLENVPFIIDNAMRKLMEKNRGKQVVNPKYRKLVEEAHIRV